MGESSTNHTAERALLDYLDGLLHEGDEVVAASNTAMTEAVVETAPEIVTANVLPLVSANTNARQVRPVRVVEALQTFAEPRPFAEPVRPLRMPLPPIAPPQPVEARVEAPIEVPVARPVAPPQPQIVPEPSQPAPVIEAIDPEPVIAEAIEVQTPAPPAWAANGRPQWAQQPFECLLFKSGGLTLAVPLVELGSIYPLEQDDISGIFGQIEWFLGIMRTKYGNLRVVDTARVVMPERYRDDMATGYHFVLSLNNSDWGLGIDAIDGTALLDPEAVRWRSSDRSKRPWLAGTVIEKMCALLDVAQMRFMFDQLDRKRRDR